MVFHNPLKRVGAFVFNNPNRLVSSAVVVVESSVPMYLLMILSYSPLDFKVANPWLNASINSVF